VVLLNPEQKNMDGGSEGPSKGKQMIMVLRNHHIENGASQFSETTAISNRWWF